MITDNSSYLYKPTVKRLLLIFAGIPIGAYLLGFSLGLLTDYLRNDVGDIARQAERMLMGICAAIVLSLFTIINREHYSITITPSTISGPSNGGMIGDTTFSLDQLDLESINRITFWDKFWMRRVIRSKDKERIIISRLAYSKAQENEIITTLLSAIHQD